MVPEYTYINVFAVTGQEFPKPYGFFNKLTL